MKQKWQPKKGQRHKTEKNRLEEGHETKRILYAAQTFLVFFLPLSKCLFSAHVCYAVYCDILCFHIIKWLFIQNVCVYCSICNRINWRWARESLLLFFSSPFIWMTHSCIAHNENNRRRTHNIYLYRTLVNKYFSYGCSLDSMASRFNRNRSQAKCVAWIVERKEDKIPWVSASERRKERKLEEERGR